jgi:DNA-binding NarL/FixJ family response regulator
VRQRQLGPSDGGAPIRCLVADEYPAIVKGISDSLDEVGMDVVARAVNGREAIEGIESLQPTVAVVDVQLPELSGIEVTVQAGRSTPSTAVVLYAGVADQALLVEAVDAGARGFVLKEAPLTDLVRAVETVSRGGVYVDPVLAGTLAGATATGRLVQLTKRERTVLRMLADGKKYDEIARELVISPETVRTHVRKAMERLDASTRTQAVATALRQALIA